MTTATLAPVGRPAPQREPVQVARRPLLGWAVRDSVTIAWRSLVGALRTPQLLVFVLVQPVMFLLLFRYVFGGAIAVPGADFVDYLVPGILVQTSVFAGVATGVGLAEDLGRGVVDRFRTLPMARSAVVAGRTLADLVRNTAALSIMIGVGFAVGYRPDGGALGLLGGLALVVLLGYAFTWFYVIVGLLVRDAEAAQAAGFLVTFPLTFASSVFVPTGSMPGWLRTFAENQPITLTADAVRALNGIGDASVWPALAWAAAIMAVLVPVSVALYRRTA